MQIKNEPIILTYFDSKNFLHNKSWNWQKEKPGYSLYGLGVPLEDLLFSFEQQ